MSTSPLDPSDDQICTSCKGLGYTDPGDPETGATSLDYPCPDCGPVLDAQDAQKRIDLLRAALNLIAYSRWSTEPPGQFVEVLQKMARDALIDYASARRAKDRLAQHTSGTPSPTGDQA